VQACKWVSSLREARIRKGGCRQFVKRQKRGGKQGEVEHCCKHCEAMLSGTNVTRLKTHLLNGRGGPARKGFLRVKRQQSWQRWWR